LATLFLFLSLSEEVYMVITLSKGKLLRFSLLAAALAILGGLVMAMARPTIERAAVTRAARIGIASVIPTTADTVEEFLQEAAPHLTTEGQRWFRESLDPQRFAEGQKALKAALGEDLQVEIASVAYARPEGLPGDPVAVQVQGQYVGHKGSLAFDRYFFVEKEGSEWLFTGHHIGAGGAQ
jgi:hypothetical protein